MGSGTTIFDMARPAGRVVYDPKIHKDIIYRGLLAGLTPDVIAVVCGVSLKQLSDWMVRHEDLHEAQAKALRADMNVVETAYRLATGYHDEKGREVRPNPTLVKWWLSARLGWTDKPPPAPPEKPLDDYTDEELGRVMGNLMEIIERRKIVPTTARELPAEEYDEPDPDF